MPGTAVIQNCPAPLQCIACGLSTTSIVNFGGLPMCYSSVFGAADGTQQMFDEYSTIVQGTFNCILQYNVFGPGFYGCHNAIVNGAVNNICGCYDIIGTGCGSCICDSANTALGPQRGWNFMGVGFNSCIVDSYVSVIGGGGAHCIFNSYTGVIAGGDHNCIIAAPGASFVCRAGVFTGALNSVIGANCGTVVGGFQNSITAGASHGFIGNGNTNVVNNNATFGFIGNGSGNNVYGPASYPFIGNGQFNAINNNADYSFISNGCGNFVNNNASFSSLGGGGGNSVRASSYNSIFGGQDNNINNGGGDAGNTIHSFIGGGHANVVNGSASVIGGGCCNTVQAGAIRSIIGSGELNNLDGNWNVITGGYNNYINCCYSIIGSGLNNIINVSGPAPIATNGILSGTNNRICGSTVFSGMGSGGNNVILDNYASHISGGDNNCIDGSVTGCGYRGYIGGGVGNHLFANISSILGGMTIRSTRVAT